MHKWLVPLLMVSALAGCIGDGEPAATPFSAPATRGVGVDALPTPMGAELFPPARPLVRTVTWAVETSEGPQDDVAVQFYGVHDVFDEFARPSPSLVFGTRMPDPRGNEMHYEEAFALSDGRNLGLRETQYNNRLFSNPDLPIHESLMANGPLAFLPLWSVHGDLDARVPFSVHERVFSSPSTKAPLPGACTMVQMDTAWNESYDPRASLLDVHRTTMCFDDGNVPVWTYVEWSSESNSGWASFRRADGDFPIPPAEGTPWPRAGPFTPQPWQVYLEDLQGDPLYGPPSSQELDWSDLLRVRTETLLLSPAAQLEFASLVGPAYIPRADMGGFGWDATQLLTVPGLLEPPVPEARWSWITFGDGGSVDPLAVVETYQTAPESEPIHRASHTIGISSINPPAPTWGEVPELVAPGDLQFDYGPLFSYQAEYIDFFVWPIFDFMEVPEYRAHRASWTVFEECFEEHTGPFAPRYAHFSAVTGQLNLVTELETYEGGCRARGPSSGLEASERGELQEFAQRTQEQILKQWVVLPPPYGVALPQS